MSLYLWANVYILHYLLKKHDKKYIDINSQKNNRLWHFLLSTSSEKVSGSSLKTEAFLLSNMKVGFFCFFNNDMIIEQFLTFCACEWSRPTCHLCQFWKVPLIPWSSIIMKDIAAHVQFSLDNFRCMLAFLHIKVMVLGSSAVSMQYRGFGVCLTKACVDSILESAFRSFHSVVYFRLCLTGTLLLLLRGELVQLLQISIPPLLTAQSGQVERECFLGPLVCTEYCG